MIRAGRTPCLNPRCRRTFDQKRDGEAVVCGKCWRLLPVALTRRYKALRARDRRIGRLARRKRAGIRNTAAQLAVMSAQWDRAWDRLWNAIRVFFRPVEKPEGLDAFLEIVGL